MTAGSSETRGFHPDPEAPDLGLPGFDQVPLVLTDVGARIREARKVAGLTQEALAALLPVGRAEVGHYETGNADPRVLGLLRIAEALGVPAASLLPDQAPKGAQGAAEGREPSLPEGIYGRIELPGYRNHTGWVTEETRFGVQMAVVRDWDGRVVAEVAPGPLCQFVHLPTPLKRPEPQERAAITSGNPWGDEPDDWDERNPF